MFWVLLAVSIIAFIYYFIIQPRKYWKIRGVKHGPIVPIFGDNWKNIVQSKSFAEMLLVVYNSCPGTRYSGMYQMIIPTLVIKDPELVKQITVKDFDHFVDHRAIFPEDVDPLWEKNLLALNGNKWRHMRATLSPSFTSAKMRTMFVLMEETAEDFVKYFESQDKELITVEMKDTFSRFAIDVIGSSAFGIKCDSLGNRNNTFFEMGKDITDFGGLRRRLVLFGYMLIPKILKFFKLPLFSKESSTFFRTLVAQTIKTREENNIVRPDMIQLLMEARKGNLKYEESAELIDTGFATVEESDVGKAKIHLKDNITNDDITAQALIFFFAGFDPVSGLMCFVCYELAIHQELQEKLRDEVLETLEDCGGKLTYEALLKMKYMDMVVSETLRKWPVAIVLDRICTKPYTIHPVTPEEKPVHLKVGDSLWIPTFAFHRDPHLYPDPEKFNPERFNEENKGNIHPYSYFPFGVGPRNCIGSRFALLETKAVIFHVLSKFQIVPVEKTPIPLKLSRKSFNLNPEDGFWLGLKRIHSDK